MEQLVTVTHDATLPITGEGTTTTVTWTYDDGNGNTSTQTQNVIIDDVTAPVVPNLELETFECRGTPIAPTTTDNCGSIITGTTTTIFPIETLGNNIIEWTFDDGNGNITTANQTIIITSCVADLSLIKTIDNTVVKIGDTVLYTLELSNSGPESAFGVQVTDVLPEGLVYDVSSSIIPTGTTYNDIENVWNLSSLEIANGETILLSIGARVVSAGIINNKSEVTQSNQLDPDSIPNNGN